jgi:multiple sugar transport system permease protein
MQQRSNLQRRQIRKGILLLVPAMALISIFYLSPAIVSVFYSLTNISQVGRKAVHWSFVGAANYAMMLRDGRFWVSLGNTAIFLLFSAIIGQNGLGFLIAYLMQRKSLWFRRLVGMAVLLGLVTPEVVVSIIFFAFFGVEGSLNQGLALFGISPKTWLFSCSMLSIILANIWRGTAFSMLMFQSALDSVPSELLESAHLDGAGPLRTLVGVTLPVIQGTILTNTVLITISTIGVFGMIFALTGGGPGLSSTTVPIYMYQKAFASYQIGYGSAIAIVLLCFGIALSLFYTKAFRSQA